MSFMHRGADKAGGIRMSFACPYCGEEWAPNRNGGETRLRFMNRHEEIHKKDIPSGAFRHMNGVDASCPECGEQMQMREGEEGTYAVCTNEDCEEGPDGEDYSEFFTDISQGEE